MRAAAILKSFSSKDESLCLHTIVERSQQSKATAFRLSETLVEAGLLERVGKQGYRLRIDVSLSKRFRIGYAAQSNVVSFTSAVTDSLVSAASNSNVNLMILNNKFSPKMALSNADTFVKEQVDLVIESQFDVKVARQIGAKFVDAHIPFIAIDIPHPGAFYFGADNYKAGRIAGRYLAKWCAKSWGQVASEIYFIGADAAGAHLNARLHGMHDGMCEMMPQLRNIRPCHIDTKGQFERTHDCMRRSLRQHKVQRALVGCVNDVSALAALQAFRDFGMEDECAIAGQDGTPEARDELRTGSSRLVCTVAYYPETYGERVIQYALNILNNKPVPPALFSQHELLTKDNVEKVYPNDNWMKSAATPVSVLPGVS